jgi:uncharacterized membrane protein
MWMMLLRIRNFWYRLRSTFWFLPTLMTTAAVSLSFATVALDEALRYRENAQPWLIYTGGPDGARAVLSIIAGSSIAGFFKKGCGGDENGRGGHDGSADAWQGR